MLGLSCFWTSYRHPLKSMVHSAVVSCTWWRTWCNIIG